MVDDAGIRRVVDIRRFPGSRANEAAARGRIPEILAEGGIDYRWDERLGGRRRLTKEEDANSPDTWWRVAAFRAYCAWTRTPEFRCGLHELRDDVAAVRTAVMCSETVWWRCHRRIVADVVTVDGVDVEHLLPGGRLDRHMPSAGARAGPDGLVWDG